MFPRTLRVIVILVLAAAIVTRAVADSDSNTKHRATGKGPTIPLLRGGGGTLFFDATYHPHSVGPWWKTDVDGEVRHTRGMTSLPAGIAIVPAPGLPGVWAAEFSVSPATAHAPSGGPAVERTELAATPGSTVAWQGRVTWYSWAMYFPRGFHSPDGHSTIVDQDKRVNGRCGPPNLAVEVSTEPLDPGDSSSGMVRLETEGGFITDNTNLSLGNSDDCPGISDQSFPLVPFKPSHWFYVLLRVAWSDDPSTGSVMAWINGCPVLPFTHVPTLYSDSGGAYWRQGLYERETPGAESDIQLGVRIGTSPAVVTQGALSPARPRNCG